MKQRAERHLPTATAMWAEHAATPAQHPTSEPVLKGSRVLILDKSPASQNLMARAFQEQGYGVAVARTLAEAIPLLEAFNPSLVLSEMHLDDADGEQVCRALRKHAKKLTPIVLVSGIPEGELEQRARSIGADRYHCKARGLSELLDLVEELSSEILF